MTNPETNLQNRIMLALGSRSDCRVWRNESAGAWVGKQVARDGAHVTLSGARMIQAGLCTGSSDIIGIHESGRFIAMEVKTDAGNLTEQQQNFLETVALFGGIAAVVRSVEEAVALIDGVTG